MAATMHFTTLALLLLCVANLLHVGSASNISPPPQCRRFPSLLNALRGGSLQSRRWERMDGQALGGTGGEQSLQTSLKSAAAVGGRACNFYLWDAPSALLHKWCQHLVKDCVYEGLGGRKFVRIEPGSILQLLYPCSRYSPDRCVVCGGNFQDHLTLWWGNHLYTPFDQNVDNTYTSGSVLEPKYPGMAKPRPRPASRRTTATRPTPTTRPKRTYSAATEMIRSFAFHRNYVTDLASLAPGVSDVTEKTRRIRRELERMQSNTGSRMEVRMLTEKKMAYVVPAPVNTKRQSLFLRYVVLNAIDRLVGMQETENDRIRLRERTSGCCS